MSVQLVVSSREHFEELVTAGFAKLQIKPVPSVRSYLVGLLEFYLDTNNLFPAEVSESGERQASTMAEMWLRAGQVDGAKRIELLKQLGDRSLYISGFFSDSLQRKIVDVDYYADLGGAAYLALAKTVKEDTVSQMYRIFSRRFVEFVDVLSFISQKTMVQSDESLLRLYDRYMRTGSELARDRLTELGVVTMPFDQRKKTKQ